ncbi:MAG: amidohydrolase [Acetobacteraceae bacterium]|nr:amidohydrolase [Acetobacteraceae bacterium]
MIRVDAHHHVWRLDRGDYDWLTPDMPIYRDYGLDDLRPLLGDIDATVLVQAAPTEAETEFLLQTARGSRGLVRGVVGWTDLEAPGAVQRIEALAKDPLLKGLRPMLENIEDTDWIISDAVHPALRAMADAGLRLDALIQPRHLSIMPVLAKMHPKLNVVIDHGAKPPISTRELEPWAADLARVARETRMFCKLSGLGTEAGGGWMMNDVRPYADHILDSFGPSRVMWGSDWPVVELTTPYQRWHTISQRFLFRFGLEERDEILCDTAVKFYGLK